MKTLTQFIAEQQQTLEEALVTFGGKAYPRGENVVIVAGGAGSGKGFIINNLLGIEAKTLDVDKMKELALKSDKFKAAVKSKYGKDLNKMNLKNPDDVSDLHTLIDEIMGINDSRERNLFKSILMSSHKPNLIFDVTMKDLKKFQKITTQAGFLGYEKKNIHIVWVVNRVSVAAQQNRDRERVVPEKIFLQTHAGAKLTLTELIRDSATLRSGMDGDYWIVFNSRGEDAEVRKSIGNTGSYIQRANYHKIKKAGATLDTMKVTKELMHKVQEYTTQ